MHWTLKLCFLVWMSLCSLGYGLKKEQAIYLMQAQEVKAALALYEEYQKELGRHDFEILVQMGKIILEQGVRHSDPLIQLSSLYGTSMAQISSSLDILEQGIRSQNLETQLASIQMLAHLHDDHGDELLTKAMASSFLMARIEAGYYLAERKHRKATGHLESLMFKMPPEFWFYFPPFFALIGTHDAIQVLKKLMEDPHSSTRSEAILSAAKFGRDDLLPRIRAHATHHELDEQEAAATALGMLGDSSSRSKLEHLSLSPSSSIKLAALRSLYWLGKQEALSEIGSLAKKHDLYAIALLGELGREHHESTKILADLLSTSCIQTRFNATYALLLHRDPRCLKTVGEFLLRDSKDLGFQPIYSIGHSLTAWKVVPSLGQQGEHALYLREITRQVKEKMIAAALELAETDFLTVATTLFDHRELELVPLLVQLLENHASKPCINLLQTYAESAGAPLIRMYCNLALFRLKQKGPYEKRLESWIQEAQKWEMIQFRPYVPWNMKKTMTTYELAPEQTTRLLLESYEALADRHDDEAITLLLQGLKNGHPKNRFALAGLLIHTLQ